MKGPHLGFDSSVTRAELKESWDVKHLDSGHPGPLHQEDSLQLSRLATGSMTRCDGFEAPPRAASHLSISGGKCNTFLNTFHIVRSLATRSVHVRGT